MISTILDRETEATLGHGDAIAAHIVKTKPGESATAVIMQARVFGEELEALCGHRWIPSRDPKQYPLCDKCKEIYDLYRGMIDGLNDLPQV